MTSRNLPRHRPTYNGAKLYLSHGLGHGSGSTVHKSGGVRLATPSSKLDSWGCHCLSVESCHYLAFVATGLVPRARFPPMRQPAQRETWRTMARFLGMQPRAVGGESKVPWRRGQDRSGVSFECARAALLTASGKLRGPRDARCKRRDSRKRSLGSSIGNKAVQIVARW
jgi:hypothetical protein